MRAGRAPRLASPIPARPTTLPHPHLLHAIEHAAHLLPAQGPITVFIHHNTLHAFEDVPFTEAVAKGAKLFGCQPYLSEQRYRDELATGRIRQDDLDAMLREDLGDRASDQVPPRCTRFDLRRAMLQYPTRSRRTPDRGRGPGADHGGLCRFPVRVVFARHLFSGRSPGDRVGVSA